MVSWAANRLDIFATDADSQLAWTWWDGTTWNAWKSLGNQLTSTTTAASWTAGRIDCFGLVAGGSLQHTWYQGTWGGWDSQGIPA